MSVVPEDKRMSLVNGIFLTHPDNAVMKNVFGAINTNPGPSPIEQQAFATIEQMKDAIGQKNQQIQELQEQIKRYELYQDNNDKSIRAEFAKMDLQHQYNMEDAILKAQLDNGLDADKAALDVQKSQMELEKQAIQLDTAKVKATADMAKAFGGVKNENSVQY